ncbi:MAG: L-histidine N(alpha)-methyltransferase [Rhodospirillales bacterium CG15_BIG_FIL_POST_REV_8_21_14_020_66_15]|nr:MAG: L-histidine N(alpha)-methyltransferase [Rhodospirillales bacterium CG15_BIG_FIL_POST_REV_8_21_14_020_66_15]
MDAFADIAETRLDDAAREAFARDVIAGLSGAVKTLPCKWFYDLRGSELFEEITRLDEYYPTRTELALLADIAPGLGGALPREAWVVEFGSGSSRKSDLFLNALDAPRGYVPIDVAADYLEAAAGALADRLPHLEVVPVVGDFTAEIDLPPMLENAPTVGFFPGSTIGNFEPAQAARFLERARRMLGAEAHMVVGVDLKKDLDVLLAAYDDAKGVTADFNLNLLDRINRELDGGFDRDRFRHRVRYDDAEGRVEMHLESTVDQTVRVDGHAFDFRAGETIHTENSYKYAVDDFARVARDAGWRPARHWTDADDLFSIHLLAAA